MKTKDTWVLDFCSPVIWTVDMSHPGGEWDEELEPGSPEYNSRQLSMAGSDFMHVISVWGRQFGKAMSTLVEAFEPVIQKVAQDLEPVGKMLDQLTEDELKKNGIHKIKSVNPRVQLPPRTFNSGPPEPRFDRRKK